jgi:hypothetical protein
MVKEIELLTTENSYFHLSEVSSKWRVGGKEENSPQFFSKKYCMCLPWNSCQLAQLVTCVKK